MKTIITLHFTNRDCVSGRANSLNPYGSKDLQFTDANVVGLRQEPQTYESELAVYKEPQLDHLNRIVFTVFDTIQNYPVAELMVELGQRRMRWIKPVMHYRLTPFELDLELDQSPAIPSQLGSIAV